MEYNYLEEVLESGNLTSADMNGGKFVQKLESQIKSFTKAKHAIAVSSGTAALYISILALGLKNQKIAFPSFTFKATKNAILATNNTPIPIDVRLDNMTIDTKIKNVDCIIPVHLYGNVSYMDELLELGIPIIEDCCQSLGSKLHTRSTGTFGDLGCFSFYPSKIISSGEGGMIITNNDQLAEKCRLLRNHGDDKTWGLNFRMSEIHASIAVEMAESINKILDKRMEKANLWKELLKNEEFSEPRKNEIRNNILFTITTTNRNELIKKYPQSRIYYPYTLGAGSNAELLSKTVLSFPTT